MTTIPFASSATTSLGVELELHLLDSETGALASASTPVLEAIGDDDGEHPKAKHELFQSTIEIITGICDSPAEARGDLAATLSEVRAAGEALGIVPMSAGTHPFGCAADQHISPNPRYHAMVEEMRDGGHRRAGAVPGRRDHRALRRRHPHPAATTLDRP